MKNKLIIDVAALTLFTGAKGIYARKPLKTLGVQFG